MNGRIYDPMLARFLSADPMTESPFSTQGWNRYAYVGNSPTNFTDPSGYCFLSCGWKSITRAIGQALIRVPILRTVIQIAAVALCGGVPICGVIVSGVTSAAITGLTGGNFSQSLRAGLISATTALAMNVVGTVTLGGDHAPAAFGSDQHIANIAGHAAVGCASAAASGGNCGQGAAGAAVGALGAPLIHTYLPESRIVGSSDFVAGAAITAGLGGLASVASGGKFENGASTAAFGYLYNFSGSAIQWSARLALGALGTAVALPATLLTAACVVICPTPMGDGTAQRQDGNIYYHYTNESAMNGIIASQTIFASTLAANPNDAKLGDGVYVSNIPPGTRSNNSLAAIFLRQGYRGDVYTHFLGIETTGLSVIQHPKRPNVFVIPTGGAPLPIAGRLRSSGKN